MFSRLHDAVSAVCPVSGIQIGKISDKATWVIDFANWATPQQKADAQAIVDSFDVAAENQTQRKLRRYKRRAAIRAAREIAQADGETEVVNRLDTEFNEA